MRRRVNHHSSPLPKQQHRISRGDETLEALALALAFPAQGANPKLGRRETKLSHAADVTGFDSVCVSSS